MKILVMAPVCLNDCPARVVGASSVDRVRKGRAGFWSVQPNDCAILCEGGGDGCGEEFAGFRVGQGRSHSLGALAVEAAHVAADADPAVRFAGFGHQSMHGQQSGNGETEEYPQPGDHVMDKNGLGNKHLTVDTVLISKQKEGTLQERLIYSSTDKLRLFGALREKVLRT